MIECDHKKMNLIGNFISFDGKIFVKISSINSIEIKKDMVSDGLGSTEYYHYIEINGNSGIKIGCGSKNIATAMVDEIINGEYFVKE